MFGLTRNYFSNGPSLCLTMPRHGPELYMWTNGFETLCLCSCLLLERSRGTCPTSQGISLRKSLANAIVQGEVRILVCPCLSGVILLVAHLLHCVHSIVYNVSI